MERFVRKLAKYNEGELNEGNLVFRTRVTCPVKDVQISKYTPIVITVEDHKLKR